MRRPHLWSLLLVLFAMGLANYSKWPISDLGVSASHIADNWSGTDRSSYAMWGLHRLQHGNWELWPANLWPPGMAATIYLLVKFFGDSLYTRASWLLSITLMISVVLFLTYRAARQANQSWKVFTIYLGLIIMFLDPFVNLWIFWPNQGAVMAEPKTMFFFLANVFLLCHALEKRSWKSMIAAGLCAAGAAYMRSFFNIFALCVFATILILGLAEFLLKLKQSSAHSQTKVWQSRSLFVLSLFFIGSYEAALATCHADPELCQKINSDDKLKFDKEVCHQAAISTFLKYPLKWWRHKIKFLNYFWVGEPKNFAERVFFSGLSLALFFAYLALISIRIFKDKMLTAEAIIIFAFSIAHVAVFTFFHFEHRYSLFLRVFSYLIIPMFLLSSSVLEFKKPSQNDKPRCNES